MSYLISIYSIFTVNGSVRIILFITFSFLGMQLVAQTNGLTPRLFGIIVASISSGAGELSFLQLTHWHDKWALPGFAIGTGMAGLAGSYLYLALTTWIGLSVHASLNVSSVPSYISTDLVPPVFIHCGILYRTAFSDKVTWKL
jgi:battenin